MFAVYWWCSLSEAHGWKHDCLIMWFTPNRRKKGGCASFVTATWLEMFSTNPAAASVRRHRENEDVKSQHAPLLTPEDMSNRVDARNELGTRNWKCFAGTRLWTIGKLLREMRPDGTLCGHVSWISAPCSYFFDVLWEMLVGCTGFGIFCCMYFSLANCNNCVLHAGKQWNNICGKIWVCRSDKFIGKNWNSGNQINWMPAWATQAGGKISVIICFGLPDDAAWCIPTWMILHLCWKHCLWARVNHCKDPCAWQSLGGIYRNYVLQFSGWKLGNV